MSGTLAAVALQAGFKDFSSIQSGMDGIVHAGFIPQNPECEGDGLAPRHVR